MNLTLDTFDLETEKGCDSEDAYRCANELCRTLMTWRQPTAHCHVIQKQNFNSTHELTQASHFGPYLLILQKNK